jgi:hypothetical protein
MAWRSLAEEVVRIFATVSLCALCLVAVSNVPRAQSPGDDRRILFLRGGSGTLPVPDDELCDLFDFSTAPGNAGFGELGALLVSDGFVVEQAVEGPVTSPGQVDLASLPLAQYSVIVFGSNNATYSAGTSLRVRAFVEAGGGVLFMSDAIWGMDPGMAPTSDQTFLDHFDLVMNQDNGSYAVSRAAGDFVIHGIDMGIHPILVGPDGLLGSADDVNTFDGAGVSPATVTHLLPGVDPVVLARAIGPVQTNDNPSGGSQHLATAEDGALVVAEFGAGRVACTFDRNTFFNANGGGTELANFDNRQYARNLFTWLAGPLVRTYGAGKANSLGLVAQMDWSGTPSSSSANFTVGARDGVPGNLGVMFHSAGFAQTPFAGGTTLVASPLVRLPAQLIDASGAVSYPFPISPTSIGTVRYFQFWYRDLPDPAGFGFGLSNGLRACFTL